MQYTNSHSAKKLKKTKKDNKTIKNKEYMFFKKELTTKKVLGRGLKGFRFTDAYPTCMSHSFYLVSFTHMFSLSVLCHYIRNVPSRPLSHPAGCCGLARD